VPPAPPLPSKDPAQGDTTRYVTWLATTNVKTTNTPRENTGLRLGDWGFFDSFAGLGQPPSNQAGLDKSGHAIQGTEKGNWWEFLTTSGLDATGAQDRVAWLLKGVGVTPQMSKFVKAPTLSLTKDSVTLEAYYMIPGPGSAAHRVTITATPSNANRLVIDKP